jgi:hypothetical protein
VGFPGALTNLGILENGLYEVFQIVKERKKKGSKK